MKKQTVALCLMLAVILCAISGSDGLFVNGGTKIPVTNILIL